MLIRTSIAGMVHEMSATPPRAYLYDYDIDGSALKSAHTTYLDDSIVTPILADKSTRWALYLMGTTSRTGGYLHNLVLAKSRTQNIVDDLRGKLAGASVNFNPVWIGEFGAALKGKKPKSEDAGDRAVQIALIKGIKPPPPPIVRPKFVLPPIPPVFIKFRIRLSLAVSAAYVVLAGDYLHFEIWDTYRNLACM